MGNARWRRRHVHKVMSKANQLTPAFQLNLNNQIQQGLATFGKYAKKQPCLTCATSGGKVFIHNPHEKTDLAVSQPSTDANAHIQYLNINRTITAMTAGPLDPKKPGDDILLVGTQTNLLAYDVMKNKDVFYREVADGINSMTFGKVGSITEQLAIVGGNCSIQGFDSEGNELFWTVTGDNVTALALIDIDEDQLNELLVGSEDYEIRIFQNEEVISETTETDKLLALSPLYSTRFGYALGNGTIGVYDRATRVWRFKSKHGVNCIHGHDLDSDGAPELISGWANGKVEVRSDKNGEVVFRDSFSSAVASILVADYRMDGRDLVMAASVSGDVRGYLPVDTGAKVIAPGSGGAAVSDASVSDETLKLLLQQKQDLSFQIQKFEELHQVEQHPLPLQDHPPGSPQLIALDRLVGQRFFSLFTFPFLSRLSLSPPLSPFSLSVLSSHSFLPLRRSTSASRPPGTFYLFMSGWLSPSLPVVSFRWFLASPHP
eukprot:NODE_184_length_1699_cov_201.142424_g21_i1.p1 GENE.NODE_184_length_1699_cov_201.142424_g21_i1~~NODE_184_length_1699_cov_201.142424_g21_i1.p1  ORF type:complete len:497 (+),score=117.79 NODE_184_length_1699_cov_201.142424_g21_i1:25-1491(+)